MNPDDTKYCESIKNECEEIKEKWLVFNYCTDSLSALDTVNKNFLPHLFELKNLADVEEQHEKKKAVR